MRNVMFAALLASTFACSSNSGSSSDTVEATSIAVDTTKVIEPATDNIGKVVVSDTAKKEQ